MSDLLCIAVVSVVLFLTLLHCPRSQLSDAVLPLSWRCRCPPELVWRSRRRRSGHPGAACSLRPSRRPHTGGRWPQALANALSLPCLDDPVLNIDLASLIRMLLANEAKHHASRNRDRMIGDVSLACSREKAVCMLSTPSLT